MIEIDHVNWKSLKEGDPIVMIDNGEVSYYYFLMIHPNNTNYVLLIDNIDKEGKKIYIPTFIGGGFFYNYTRKEVYEKRIKQLEDKIERLKNRMKQL